MTNFHIICPFLQTRRSRYHHNLVGYNCPLKIILINFLIYTSYLGSPVKNVPIEVPNMYSDLSTERVFQYSSEKICRNGNLRNKIDGSVNLQILPGLFQQCHNSVVDIIFPTTSTLPQAWLRGARPPRHHFRACEIILT